MSTAVPSLKGKKNRGKLKCGREPSAAKSHQCFRVVLIKKRRESKRRGGKETWEGENTGEEERLDSLHAFQRLSRVANFLLMTQLWKWKRCSAWLMSPSLTPNGKKIPWYAQFSVFLFYPNLLTTPLTIITQSHCHFFFSWLSLSLNLSLHSAPLPSLPPSFLVFESLGWPWAAAASEVAKVQSQYQPTKLVKY